MASLLSRNDRDDRRLAWGANFANGVNKLVTAAVLNGHDHMSTFNRVFLAFPLTVRKRAFPSLRCLSHTIFIEFMRVKRTKKTHVYYVPFESLCVGTTFLDLSVLGIVSANCRSSN